MAKYTKGKIVLAYDKNHKIAVDGKLHDSDIWGIHKGWNETKKSYLPSYNITSLPIGKALCAEIKTYKEARFILENVLKDFPALLTVKSDKYWDVINNAYGKLVHKRLQELKKQFNNEKK